MATVDEPFIIYTNVIKMLTYRKLELVGAAMTSTEFNQKINLHDYVMISATKSDKNHQIYIINVGSKYSNKSPEFAKLLATVKDPTNLSLMYITPEAFSNSIIGKITEFHSKNPTTYIEHHEYFKFCAEHPKNVLVSKHEIANAEEVEEYCKVHCTKPSDFPVINVRDTQAIWIGARPGDICKIYRISENTGYTIVYRPVVGSPI
jgi:DNA-directed RNA polymerase subunit H (RpoH/RPB5)